MAREAKDIIDKGVPLSECTEEELQAVIDLKAQWKADDAANKAAIQAIADASAAKVEAAREQSEKAIAASKAAMEWAMKMYEATVFAGQEVKANDEQEDEAGEGKSEG